MTRFEPHAWDHGKQTLLNAHPVPARFTDATTPIPVRVTLRWETDGVEVQEGLAVAWTARLVLVQLQRETRVQTNAVWVSVEDVERV